MAAAFVKNIGSGSVDNGTVVTITVPAGGAAAGNVLIVRAGRPDTAASITSIADTQSNTYADVQTTGTTGNSAMLWRSLLGTALVSGDTITITFSGGMGQRAAVVDEFSGLTTTEDGKTGAQGTSTTPSAAITPANAADVVATCLYVEAGSGDSFTEDADSDGGDSWHGLTTVTQSTNIVRGAYKITTSATTQTYDPTLGTSRAWTDIIVALQESGGAPAAASRPFHFTLVGVQ